MENNLEKNREDSPPEVRLPIVSRELRQKAIIIAEFRTKLPRDSVVKPRVEPSSFTVETKGDIIIDYDISMVEGGTKVRIRSMENKYLLSRYGLQIIRTPEGMITLTTNILLLIDIIYNPKKHGLKAISLEYINPEAHIIGESLSGEKFRLSVFDDIGDIEERNLLIKAIIGSIQSGPIPIPGGKNS